jgi:hypothetical protein
MVAAPVSPAELPCQHTLLNGADNQRTEFRSVRSGSDHDPSFGYRADDRQSVARLTVRSQAGLADRQTAMRPERTDRSLIVQPLL